MSRYPDSGRLDLTGAFHSVQEEMRAQLALSGFIEHSPTAGTATECLWLDLLTRYLPKRYSAAPAFVIDSEGGRSRQIDIAIFDNLNSPLLFTHQSCLHVPAESVHAVFEVKQIFTKENIQEAAQKGASVCALLRSPVRVMSGNKLLPAPKSSPILAGILATSSRWKPENFSDCLKSALISTPHRLDLGCCLARGSFERDKKVTVSLQKESLKFFILRLLERLRAQGTAPIPDLMKYGRLGSFK
jgi:hypothetical protein